MGERPALTCIVKSWPSACSISPPSGGLLVATSELLRNACAQVTPAAAPPYKRVSACPLGCLKRHGGLHLCAGPVRRSSPDKMLCSSQRTCTMSTRLSTTAGAGSGTVTVGPSELCSAGERGRTNGSASGAGMGSVAWLVTLGRGVLLTDCVPSGSSPGKLSRPAGRRCCCCCGSSSSPSSGGGRTATKVAWPCCWSTLSCLGSSAEPIAPTGDRLLTMVLCPGLTGLSGASIGGMKLTELWRLDLTMSLGACRCAVEGIYR